MLKNFVLEILKSRHFVGFDSVNSTTSQYGPGGLNKLNTLASKLSPLSYLSVNMHLVILK